MKNKSSMDNVGLRILIQISNSKSNVVVKNTTLTSTTLPNPQSQHSSQFDTSFLKNCHLCNKNLNPNKDIYMYRGDLAFCSVECRDRQISIDEMKELEASTKKMLSSSRHCQTKSGQISETQLLREELRRRHNQIPVRRTRALVS